MTAPQINWASQHDWFLSSSTVTGEVEVLDVIVADDNTTRERVLRFTDFQELKEWAGY